jgi:hypothetical protein
MHDPRTRWVLVGAFMLLALTVAYQGHPIVAMVSATLALAIVIRARVR